MILPSPLVGSPRRSDTAAPMYSQHGYSLAIAAQSRGMRHEIRLGVLVRVGGYLKRTQVNLISGAHL